MAPAAVRADLPRRWPEVARLLPDQPVGLQLAASTGSREEQQHLFWHVTGFLQALADVQPLALLLDDLQWADSASLDLLQHLARHTRASRLLLLGTYRDVEVTSVHPFAAVLRDLAREQLAERLVVRRLPLEGTAALLTASFGRGHASDAFVAALHARTEGNPFFTVEVLRDLVERGDLYQERERWQERAPGELVLPETVRAVIGQRLAHLSAACHTVLQEASVLGAAFAFAAPMLEVWEGAEGAASSAAAQEAWSGRMRARRAPPPHGTPIDRAARDAVRLPSSGRARHAQSPRALTLWGEAGRLRGRPAAAHDRAEPGDPALQ